jgi:MFS family permease
MANASISELRPGALTGSLARSSSQVAGSLADRVGRKRTFMAGLIAFAAGSTWAAFSGSVGVLIAARAGMGIGAALIMPSTLSIITATFTDRGEPQRALGFWSGTAGGRASPSRVAIIGSLLSTRYQHRITGKIAPTTSLVFVFGSRAWSSHPC